MNNKTSTNQTNQLQQNDNIITNDSTKQNNKSNYNIKNIDKCTANTSNFDEFIIKPSADNYIKPSVDEHGLHSGSQEYIIWETKRTTTNCKFTADLRFIENNKFEIGFGQFNKDDEFIVKAEHTVNKDDISIIRVKNAHDVEGIIPQVNENTIYEFELTKNICTVKITSNKKITRYRNVGHVNNNSYFFIRKWGTGEILINNIEFTGIEKLDDQLELTRDKIQVAQKLQEEDNCKKVEPDIGTIKCNICGYESDHEFLHFGNGHRPNEKCPVCSSLMRTRLYIYYLENYTNLLMGNHFKILHIAPDNCVYQKLKPKYGNNYISCDNKEGKYVDRCFSIDNIPYDDNTFDLIIANHVLEHIPDDNKVLTEFHRVLKQNGMVLMETPASYSLDKTFEESQIDSSHLRKRYYKQSNRRRIYSVNDFFRKMENIGFRALRKEVNIIPEKNFEDSIKYAMIPNPKDSLKILYKEHDEDEPDFEDFRRQLLEPDPLFIGIKLDSDSMVDNREDKLKDNYCNLCENEVAFISDDMNDKLCSKCNSRSDERLIFNEIKDDIEMDTIIMYFNSKFPLENKLKTLTVKYNDVESSQDGIFKNVMNRFSSNSEENTGETTLADSLRDINSDSVDIIVSPHVLDHEYDDEEIIYQFYRILKPNGKLLLKENVDLDLSDKIEEDYINTPTLRTRFYGMEDALRCYGIDLIHFLQFTGFNVKYEDPDKQVNNILLKNQLSKDPLLICTKR